ncbi:MAG: hypothetical protein ABSA92_11505 [Candidatus Bathyarchaeia archaeon]|jgi:hypothetical protein
MRKPLEMSDRIYRAFQTKYRFGDLGLFESIALASTQVEGLRIALSTAVISPPGEAKTRILSDVLSMFPETSYVLVDGAITEYHITKEKKYEDLNHKLFCINDIEDIIRTYPRRRVAAILSFLKNLIDGHAQILTKNDAIDRVARNFGVLINVPENLLIDSRGNLRNQFLGTFFDRTIPFRFRMDWEKWKPYWDGHRLKEATLPTIELERGSVKWDFATFRRRISNDAGKLATLKFSGLPRNIDLVTAFLCGSALLNGRERISNEDFTTLAQLKQYFGWYR